MHEKGVRRKSILAETDNGTLDSCGEVDASENAPTDNQLMKGYL